MRRVISYPCNKVKKNKLKIGDIVLVDSFAGPQVRAKLKKRIISKNGFGADGWEAVLVYKKDIDALRKKGVPYKKAEKPSVFVFDWQIIKNKSR